MRPFLGSLVIAALLALPAAPALADSPFVGTWKFDAAKSHLAGDSFTVKMLPNGTYDYTYGKVTHFVFPCDGSKYTTDVAAYTGTCTKTAAQTYAFQSFANGKLTDKDVQVISADGKTLVDTDTSYRPDGTTATTSTTWTRVGSGTGMAGTWKSATIKNPGSDVLTFEQTSAGMKFSSSVYKWSVLVKTDGSKQKITGPTFPANAYGIWKADGASKLVLNFSLGAKLYGTYTYVVSDDGATMSTTSQPVGGAMTTVVYDKQP